MYPRILLALIGTLVCCSIAAGTAQADDTISVTFGADPTEEVPLPITLAWSSATASVRAYVTVKPAGGLGCAPNYAADEPNSSDVIDNAGGTPTGSASENRTFGEPGTFTLCGYLQSSSDGAVLRATGPVALTVRSANAAVALVVPARVDPGQTFAITANVTAELRRGLFVTVKPAGGRGCEPNYAADDPISSDAIYNAAVQGSASVSENITASQTAGNYLLCAYVQEGSGDTAPEGMASAQFAVGPDPCKAARSALAAAKRKLKSAEASITRNRKAIARYKTAVRRRAKANRRHNQALLNAARKRYRTAQVSRVNARKSVTKRTAAVAKACG
jgi:hypothetical protein